jgi:uncharacterized protein YndB with AHSA1/START domain
MREELMGTDQIEKTILLRAPLPRVWRAISDSRQFGYWFGVEFDRPFAAGTHMAGKIAGTRVDEEVAKLQKPLEGKTFDIWIESIEPMKLFAFRWHPFAVDPNVDYTHEPTTLVRFELLEVPGGTHLTITESGFDRIPIARRAQAFTANEGGWQKQTTLIEKYMALHESG